MGSVLGTLGQGLVSAGPSLAAGYGAGRAGAERATESRRQFDARLQVQRESQELRRMIAEYKRALDLLELDVKKGQAEVLNQLRTKLGALAEERAEDLEVTRPGRMAATGALTRQRGAGAALLEQKFPLNLPDLEAGLLRARTSRTEGEERRDRAMFPVERENLEARTALARAQAGTIPRDDQRMDAAARALAAYRNRTAALGERREAREARQAADRLAIQRIHADAHALTAETSANVGQARIRRMNADLKRLEKSFPKEWLDQLDRDIRVGWSRGYRGALETTPEALAARERATRMLEMMYRSLGFGGAAPPAGSPQALPPDANDPAFWDRILKGTVGGLDALGSRALGFLDQLGQGALGMGQEFLEGIEATPGAFGAPPRALPPVRPPAVPDPALRSPLAPERPLEPARVGNAPAEELEESIAWLRSAGKTAELKRYLDEWRRRTGRVYPLRTYPNRPNGLSDGDIDYARVLLKKGTFDAIGKQQAAIGEWESVNDLIAAWRYLNRPDAARVSALRRRWGVPAIVPGHPRR